MTSEEELFKLTAYREVLRSFFQVTPRQVWSKNPCQANAHHDSLMCQQVAVEDVLEMALIAR